MIGSQHRVKRSACSPTSWVLQLGLDLGNRCLSLSLSLSFSLSLSLSLCEALGKLQAFNPQAKKTCALCIKSRALVSQE